MPITWDVLYNIYVLYIWGGEEARDRIVVKAVCYKPEGRGFETRRGEWFFLIYLIFPAALGPGVYSASNRNQYQKQIKKLFWGEECGRCVRQHHRHLWEDCLDNVGPLTSHNSVGLHCLLQRQLYFYDMPCVIYTPPRVFGAYLPGQALGTSTTRLWPQDCSIALMRRQKKKKRRHYGSAGPVSCVVACLHHLAPRTSRISDCTVTE
jgi:hypothetical protein